MMINRDKTEREIRKPGSHSRGGGAGKQEKK